MHQNDALERFDAPPHLPGRPARLVRAAATGLLAALVLLALSRVFPAGEGAESPARPVRGRHTSSRRQATAAPDRALPSLPCAVASPARKPAVPTAC